MRRMIQCNLTAALLVLVLCSGCVTGRGLLTAVSDDLALTTAAAAQGLTAGLFDRWLGP